MADSERAPSRIVRPLRGGQVTIPVEFRKSLGITPETLLQLSVIDGELRIKPLSVRNTVGGSPWLKELYDLFAPVREEAQRFSSEEIDAAIDEAVKAVRERRD